MAGGDGYVEEDKGKYFDMSSVTQEMMVYYI